MRFPGLFVLPVLAFGGWMLANPPALASLDHVPVLNVQSTCRAARNYGTTDPKETYRNCMLDEKEARTQLDKKWSTFKRSSRRSCVPPRPIPSYVEMLTCLEMDQDSVLPYRGGAALPSGSAPTGYAHDSAPPRPALSPGPRPAGSFH